MQTKRRGRPPGYRNPNAGRPAGTPNPNAGRRSKTRFKLPDPIVSGATVSIAEVILSQCHLCGALWWEPYGIVRWGVDDPLAVEEVAGQPEIHVPGCPLRTE